MAKDFYELFIHELKDIYSAESQIIDAMPNIIQKVNSKKLKETLQRHLKETKEQLQRLEKIGAELNENLSGGTCHAIKSILAEGAKLQEQELHNDVRDAAIISHCQRIEHYEIAVYGTLKCFARHLKYSKIEKILADSSKEEGHADKELTEIAEGTVFSKGINEACEKVA